MRRQARIVQRIIAILFVKNYHHVRAIPVAFIKNAGV